MSRFLFAGLCIIVTSMLCAPVAFAGPDDIPDKVGREHWSCRELAALAAKYDPADIQKEEVLDRKDLAGHFLAILEKVVDKCDKEGVEAIPRDDLERIFRLHEALKAELSQYEGYVSRREAIEKILARPEAQEPPFVYKVGVSGFIRGEGAGNFHLSDFSYLPGHGEGRFLYRIKPYGYWHPTDWIDIHL